MDQAVIQPLRRAEAEQQFAAIMAVEKIGDAAIVAFGSRVLPSQTNCLTDFTICVADARSIELAALGAGTLMVPGIAEFCGSEFGFHRAFSILPRVVGADICKISMLGKGWDQRHGKKFPLSRHCPFPFTFERAALRQGTRRG